MKSKPIISFIIPCFNFSHFLSEAIQSCLQVQIPQKEIIIVDDGSTDNTSAIAQSFPEAVYYYQENKGLPAARNSGLALASGEYICFLDADDWLIPENMLTSLHLLMSNPQAAMIFGRHIIQQENGDHHLHQPTIHQPIYTHLLRSNIIGNPSTVLYRYTIAKQFPFSTDPLFKGCEDYHQYLGISRREHILHHDLPVAVYRRHQTNMSSNLAMMLDSVLNVLYEHRKEITKEDELIEWRNGLKDWIKYYSYFPLRAGGKIHLNKHHWHLIKKLRWKLPEIIIQKWIIRT